MITTYHNLTINGEPTLIQRALLAAQLTGFTMVACVSDYHRLATEYVQFTFQDGRLVPAQTRAPTAYRNDSNNQKQKE